MRRRSFINTSILGATSLAVLPVACSRSLDTEVIILGGGLSGLYLAYQLEQAGRDYLLLEGRDRYGGRLFSHPTIGRDVGGRGIGDKYLETLKLVEALNVELIDITEGMGSPTSIYYQGELHGEWSDRNSNPSILEYTGMPEFPGLASLDEWYKRSDLDMPYSQLLTRQGKTSDQLRLINHSANYNSLEETSAINALHSRAFRKFNGSKRVYNFKGGCSLFIDKIVSNLNGRLESNKMITKIEESDCCIKVTCQDGTEFKSEKVVSTLPFSTLRDVAIDSPINPNQRRAIQELGYTKITQIHLEVIEPFWEEDGMPPSMWTDTSLERIMDMSATGDAFDMVCWVNGEGTAFFDKMEDQEIGAYTLKKLAEIRPSTENRLRYIGTHNWGQYPYNKGAYAEFLPGQIAWFEDMIRPTERLHFAGEHTAKASRGIEGASESAARVFKELG